VNVDKDKVTTIQHRPTPNNVNEVQSFHGLASFYRQFVQNFSTIATPLNSIAKKNVVFKWGQEQREAFESLKEKFTKAPSWREMGKTFHHTTLFVV